MRKNTNLPALLAGLVLLGISGMAAWSYFSGGLLSVLLQPGLSASGKIDFVKQYFLSFGPAAPLVYMGLVAVEVIVAPLPGMMLYAPGGAIFGGFWGGFLSLCGNVIGAGVACQLMRALGRERLARLLNGESDRLKRYDEKLSRAGVWVVLALRINPLTSSDLVSYAAGLTSIPTWKVMVGTLLGMAPLCWAQSYLAEGLLRAFPKLIYPLFVLCALYVVVAAVILRKMFSPGKAAPAAAAK